MRWCKYIFILVIAIFISGCSASYNLTIGDNYVQEDVSIVLDNNPDNLEIAERNRKAIYYKENAYYTRKINIKDNNIYLKLFYRYSFLEFRDANSFNQRFFYRNVSYNDNIFSLDCRNLRDYTTNVNFDIKIKTDRKVLKHNADSVKGNTYIWHVKYKEKDKLHVSIKIKTNELSKKAIAKKIILYILIGIGIISVIALGLLFMRSRYKKSNKF